MSTEKKQVIGTAALEYNEQGQLEAAVFYPKIKVSYDDVKSQLGDCTNKSIDDIKKCAQLLMATFFNKVSDVELRDMETTKLNTNVVGFNYHNNNLLKEVEIEFVLEA